MNWDGVLYTYSPSGGGIGQTQFPSPGDAQAKTSWWNILGTLNSGLGLPGDSNSSTLVGGWGGGFTADPATSTQPSTGGLGGPQLTALSSGGEWIPPTGPASHIPWNLVGSVAGIQGQPPGSGNSPWTWTNPGPGGSGANGPLFSPGTYWNLLNSLAGPFSFAGASGRPLIQLANPGGVQPSPYGKSVPGPFPNPPFPSTYPAPLGGSPSDTAKNPMGPPGDEDGAMTNTKGYGAGGQGGPGQRVQNPVAVNFYRCCGRGGNAMLVLEWWYTQP